LGGSREDSSTSHGKQGALEANHIVHDFWFEEFFLGHRENWEHMRRLFSVAWVQEAHVIFPQERDIIGTKI